MDTPDIPLSTPPVTQPIPPPRKSKTGILSGIILLLFGIVVGLVIDKTTILSALRIPYLTATPTTIPPASPTPTVETGNPTANWKTYTDTILGVEYKLPSKLGLLEMSGKEIRGESGTQYCVVYMGSLSKIIKPVFAGQGPCSGGIFTLGAVSKNYTAGREGGFGDYSGYFKKDNAYYARFSDKGDQIPPIPAAMVTEQTNSNGITYLKIQGESTLQPERGTFPTFGTPGEGYIGALFNITNTNYEGFNIQMQIKSPQDSVIFDQILSTFKFADTTSTADTPMITPSNTQRLTYQLPSGWTKIPDPTYRFEAAYDPTNTQLLEAGVEGLNLTKKQVNDNGIGYKSFMSIRLLPYDGGSRHTFIYKYMSNGQPPQKQDLGTDYNEIEYLYNNKSCLFLRGIYTSQMPTIWGMCDAGGGNAFLITSYSPDYETTVQTIKLLK